MTQVLKVLSLIWKSGAEIYRDESDGRLAINNAKLIHPDVLKAAEPIFNDIDQWFKSWESASAQDITIRKALHVFCGWEKNEALELWMANDNESLMLLHDWTVVLAKNGWTDLYEDYRQYENDESNVMKNRFYNNAKSWASRNK